MENPGLRRSRRLAARRHQARPEPQPRRQPRPQPRNGNQPPPRPRKQKKRDATTTSRRKTGIMDLPPEMRQIAVRKLIQTAKGPEVYVGKGSRTPIQLEPIYHTRTLPLFYSSVTQTFEYGSSYDRQLNRHPEQSWPGAYHKLRPLMACKTLYYEATAIFFREKHFVLGSSTYAHAWLRRIGQRNQVNLRNIRLKIHKEFTTTGDLNASGSLWIEVLKKLGRSARQLKVLGFQFDEDVDLWRSALLRAFLRMKTFQNLNQIDLFYCLPPSRADSEEFLLMMAASTGCASVRCLELNDSERGYKFIQKAFKDDDGDYHISQED